MSTATTSAPVKRACDSCHRRKVKCIGEGTNPCKNCVSAGLACTYNAIPQKKGPKGSRAKVLSELRETQRNAQLAAGLAHDLGFDGRALPTTFARTPGLLPPGLVESCLDFFFANVYPSQPILHQQRAQETIMSIEHSTEAYCMVVALCAYVMIQANMTVSPNLLPRPEMAQLSNVGIGHVLLEEAVRVRKGYDYLETPTHLSLLTSWLFHGSYLGLGRDNTAWSYLREATTQVHLLGLHEAETHKNDPLDISRKRVLYWLLFIAERTHALHKHRPISLYPTIPPPSLDEPPSDRPIASGLELLTNLYKSVDDTFILLWNKNQTQCNPSWVARLHNQLTEALPAYFDCMETQAVDLRISQQWLRTMLWQLSVSQGLVGMVAADSTMTFKYPIEISRDLLSMTHQFSQHAMEVHGMGLVEKLFDIACCLADVVACIPFSPDTFALGPRDYVSRFLTLFSALRGGQTRYLPLLLAKVSDVLPNFPLPRSLNIPQGIPSSAIGSTSSPLGSISSNVNDDISGLSTITSPSYPSTDLIRQLAAQTGAQLPFNTQQSLLQAPSSRVEDLSLYDTSAPHSTHSSGSAPPSQSGTPGPYESTIHPRPQLAGQGHSHAQPQMQPPHSQHGHIQGHQLGMNTSAYDPRFGMQGFDPSMVFKQDDTDGTGHLPSQGALYNPTANRDGLNHGRSHGGGYAG